MVASTYDSLVKMRKPYDELFVATIPYVLCGTVLETIRFLARKAVSIKEDSEYTNHMSRLHMRDPEEQRELERLYSDWSKDWKEAENND